MSIAELERPVDRICRLDDGDRRLRTLAPLVVDDGCDVRVRAGHHVDAVRVALLEWLPLTGGELAAIEGGRALDASQTLAAVVRPPTIWATDEAVFAACRVEQKGTRRERRDAIVAYAVTQLGEGHRERVRRVAARFARQLPLEGLPDASAMVAVGCELVESDDEACAAVAGIQLARYAMSEFVAQRRREGVPTMG